MKNKSYFIIVCIITIVFINNSIKTSSNKSVGPIEAIDTMFVEDTLNDIYIESRVRLIESVDNYIKSIAPTSVIDSEYLVDMCDLYDVDIRLVLAQGHLESHFATRGTAAKTNSMFNIGAYDGYSASKQINNGFGYADPNYSIEPYLKTLKTNYLVNGVTEEDLLNNFVNKHGWRYASSKEYELKLQRLWNNMDDISLVLYDYEVDKFLNNI